MPEDPSPSPRLNILPDPGLYNQRQTLQERMEQVGSRVDARNFGSLFRRNLEILFRKALSEMGAHEGTIWIVNPDRTHLEPAFNNGPDAAIFRESIRQPLDSGLISMVFATEQACIESEVYRHAGQDKTVDHAIGKLTCAMIAVPFYFGNQLRGVLSAVQLKATDATEDPPGFSPENLALFEGTADILQVLVDHHVLLSLIGLKHD